MWRGEKNFMRQIIENQYLSLSLYPPMPYFFFFFLLCYTFHFQQPSAKKFFHKSLAYEREKKKKNERKKEKNCIFLLPCSEVEKFLRYLFLDTRSYLSPGMSTASIENSI